MKYLGYYSEIELIAGCMLVFFSLLSLLSTFATIYLIVDMKKWNGYLKIIFTLTVCQLVFDLQFMLVPFYENRVCNRITAFLNIMGGISVSLWTNVISFLLYRIVKNLQSVNINDYYMGFLVSITLVSVIYAIVENVARYDHDNDVADWIYEVFRVVSIVFNFVVHGLISVKLNDMGFTKEANTAHDPVRVLSSRIKYYPIVQIITLSGALWYLFRYGFDTTSYGEENMTLTQKVSLCFYAISLPSAGFGYFVIFLLFQPQAYAHFRRKIKKLYFFLCCYRTKSKTPPRVHHNDADITSTSGHTANNSSSVLDFSGSRSESLLQESGGVADLDEDELVRAIMDKYCSSAALSPHASSNGDMSGNNSSYSSSPLGSSRFEFSQSH